MAVNYDQQLKKIYDHNRDETYFLLRDPNAKPTDADAGACPDEDERDQQWHN